jgi:hypothetical protein
MNKSRSFLNLLLVGACLSVPSLCQASAPASETDVDPSSLNRLSRDLQGVILSNLSLEEQGNLAAVSKLWQGCYEEHLMTPLRAERNQMLHDLPTQFHDWSRAILQDRIDIFLSEKGIVFVPLGHAFPQESAALTDQDVEPLLPQLYAKAFGEEKEILTQEDVSKLKAVIPWSRMAYLAVRSDLARKKALDSLLTFSYDTPLERFTPTLSLEGFDPHLPLKVLQKSINLTFEQDGFIFVPLAHHTSPQNSVALSDKDVEPILSQLYTKAFSEEKELLTQEDILCLKAVMPWSRMFVAEGNPSAKEKALNSLLVLEYNDKLIRFSPNLPLKTLQEKPHMLVLTTMETARHQKVLKEFFKAHPDQHVHVVADPSLNILSLSAMVLPKVRHLTLSDPQQIITQISENFMRNATELLSLDIKDLSAVTKIDPDFAAGCTSLVSFDPRGFNCVLKLGRDFFSSSPVMEELSRAKGVSFIDKSDNLAKALFNVPRDFSVHGYFTLNPDIRRPLLRSSFPRYEAVKHYLHHGQEKEKRYR